MKGSYLINVEECDSDSDSDSSDHNDGGGDDGAHLAVAGDVLTPPVADVAFGDLVEEEPLYHIYSTIASYDELERIQVTQPWKLNLTALKWIRDQNENPLGHVKLGQIDLTHNDPIYVGVIDEVVGTECTWQGDLHGGDGAKQPWSWRQFLRALPDWVARQVFRNKAGVAAFTCNASPRFYDNERIRSMAELGIHFPSNAPMWHFIVVFTDDRSVQLRPERNGRSVDVHVIREGFVSPPAGKGAAKGDTSWWEMLRAAKEAAQGNSAVADEGNRTSAETTRWDGCWQGNANWSRWHFDGNDYSNFHGWHGWQDRHSDGWQRWHQWHSADGWGGWHWDGNKYNSR